MKRAALAAALVLTVTSCAGDRDVGRRYRAERALWLADREYESLMIRPQEVATEQWAALARAYEAIGQRYAGTPAVARGEVAHREMQTVAARALFAAAQVHSRMLDSTRMDTVYMQIARDFAHLPEVAAEVALARGRLAELRGEFARAADLYQTVVDAVAPQYEGKAIARRVLDLPLLIADLRARSSPDGDRRAPYAAARPYFERIAREGSEERVRLEALARLADIAVGLQEWQEAIAILERLEARLAQLDDPPREPCDVRFAISGVQKRAGASPVSVGATLTRLLEDYPDCGIATAVLAALARNAAERDQIDEALGYLDRITAEHKEDVDAASQALLARAQLLDGAGRWPESREGYRALMFQYPISDAALAAPLEIWQHYGRLGDAAAGAAALGEAEAHYRDFIARYPPGPLTHQARERLAQTLLLERKYEQAVTEMTSLGEDLRGQPRGLALLMTAAQVASAQLSDPARTAVILARVAEVYPRTEAGRWAAQEAARLQGTTSP